MYMLDTNICIYILKSHPLVVKQKLEQVEHVCISSITYGELCFGIEKGAASKQTDRWHQLELFTQCLCIDPWCKKAAKHYGVVRAQLEAKGKIIGNNDLLIAAHARSKGSILVTNNVKEFNRVSDLKIENWIHATT
jgi:tRNA(fMet)-specific endonuclease VapC